MPDQQVTVVTIPTESSAEPQDSSRETEQAVQYGAMMERQAQILENQSRLEAELQREREARESAERQLAAVSSQTQTILNAIERAAAEEEAQEETPAADVVAIVPVQEPEPKEEKEPERTPGPLERFGHWLNSL